MRPKDLQDHQEGPLFI